jgi:AAA15 family ATPase/GTPase
LEHIHTIEIKNFKSIRHQKIEGCKRINVFVGPPNVGKSNVLEALSLFSVANPKFDIYSSAKKLVRADNNGHFFFNGKIKTSFSITLNELKLDGKFWQDGSIQLNCRNNPESITNYLFRYAIDRDLNITGMHFNSIEFPIGIEPLVFGGNILRYEFNREFTGKKGAANFTLEPPYGDNLFSLAHYDDLLKEEVKVLLKPYNLNVAFDEGSYMVKALKVLKILNEDEYFIIPFELLADTLLRLILYKAAIITNNNSILLLEEPESHMYPPFISKFTSDVVNDENNNQYFLATHSPYVLNDFMENAKDDLSIYLLEYKDGETLIHRMREDDIHDACQFGYDFFMNMETFIPGNHEKV